MVYSNVLVYKSVCVCVSGPTRQPEVVLSGQGAIVCVVMRVCVHVRVCVPVCVPVGVAAGGGPAVCVGVSVHLPCHGPDVLGVAARVPRPAAVRVALSVDEHLAARVVQRVVPFPV